MKIIPKCVCHRVQKHCSLFRARINSQSELRGEERAYLTCIHFSTCFSMECVWGHSFGKGTPLETSPKETFKSPIRSWECFGNRTRDLTKRRVTEEARWTRPLCGRATQSAASRLLTGTQQNSSHNKSAHLGAPYFPTSRQQHRPPTKTIPPWSKDWFTIKYTYE